jgi:signal transducing adaptor molecule
LIQGESRGIVGIFPSNYVEKLVGVGSGGFGMSTNPANQDADSMSKIDELLSLLSRVDPRRENLSENPRIQELYQSTLSSRPMLLRDLEERKMKHGM